MDTCQTYVLVVLYMLVCLDLSYGARDKYKQVEMCKWKKSSGSVHVLVSSSEFPQKRPLCVCLVTKTSRRHVNVTVTDFQCDTNECPWKLTFYEDGCSRQEICCGKMQNDFAYRFPNSGKFLVSHEAQERIVYYSSGSVKINISGEVTIQCGIADITTFPDKFCATTTRTTTSQTTVTARTETTVRITSPQRSTALPPATREHPPRRNITKDLLMDRKNKLSANKAEQKGGVVVDTLTIVLTATAVIVAGAGVGGVIVWLLKRKSATSVETDTSTVIVSVSTPPVTENVYETLAPEATSDKAEYESLEPVYIALTDDFKKEHKSTT